MEVPGKIFLRGVRSKYNLKELSMDEFFGAREFLQEGEPYFPVLFGE